MLKQEDGPPIDLFHRSTDAVKGAIRKWVRVILLKGVSDKCSADNPRRKDMVGISKQVNLAVTRSLLRAKESPRPSTISNCWCRLLLARIVQRTDCMLQGCAKGMRVKWMG